MKSFVFSILPAFVLLAVAHGYVWSNTTAIEYTTITVDVYTTVCDNTVFTQGTKTYSVTELTTLTITNCPCTLIKPVPKSTYCPPAPPAKPTTVYVAPVVYTTVIVSYYTTYCPATTIVTGPTTIIVTTPGIVTVPVYTTTPCPPTPSPAPPAVVSPLPAAAVSSPAPAAPPAPAVSSPAPAAPPAPAVSSPAPAAPAVSSPAPAAPAVSSPAPVAPAVSSPPPPALATGAGVKLNPGLGAIAAIGFAAMVL